MESPRAYLGISSWEQVLIVVVVVARCEQLGGEEEDVKGRGHASSMARRLLHRPYLPLGSIHGCGHSNAVFLAGEHLAWAVTHFPECTGSREVGSGGHRCKHKRRSTQTEHDYNAKGERDGRDVWRRSATRLA